MDVNEVWEVITEETKKRAQAEPVLASFFHATVLEHDSFSSTLANQLSTSSTVAIVDIAEIRNSGKKERHFLLMR